MVLSLVSNPPGVSPCSRSNYISGSSSSTPTCHLSLGFEDLTAFAHNKVLLAATLSSAVGQLSKPFSSTFLYGQPFDFKSSFRSGGFPSTHSSAVVAAATSLGLERGFSDSIFGLTVVYAALVMYDAQGVRREVGKHAKTINKVLLEGLPKSTTSEDSSFRQQPDTVQGLENTTESGFYLYEKVGHTEFEVLGGALLGFAVTLVVFLLA